MKKIISLIMIMALMLSSSFITASAENNNNEIPAFEKIGLSRRTINLSEHNGESFRFTTSGGEYHASDTVTCTITPKWVQLLVTARK